MNDAPADLNLVESESFTYLDNAATSWPKPESVLAAIQRYYRQFGVAASRGSSSRAAVVERTLQRCRRELARLINAPRGGHVIFGFNGTDVLNTAIHGLLQPGDNVVATVVEHNSVLRPLASLEQSQMITVDYARCDDTGRIDLEHFDSLVNSTTRLVCVSHVSNVTGMVQPVEQIGQICRKHQSVLLIDAGQSMGHLPVDVQKIDCQLLASAGHKGLLGPLGTAFLYVADSVADQLRPSRQGGTGTQSELPIQPLEMTQRLESGNLNAGGLFGLLAGIEFVNERGLAEIQRHEQYLLKMMLDGFAKNDLVEVHGGSSERTGILSFNIRDLDCRALGSMLDSSFGIQVRTGLHCAPLMHEALGSAVLGGSVRVSPGVFSSESDVRLLIDAVNEIASSLV